MNKKQTTIILGAFCILIFGLLPSATANDYVTYGDVLANFNTILNVGAALQINADFDIEMEILPAVLEGFKGRIVPWIDGLTYRYEDAHSIYTAIYATINELLFAQMMLGPLFTFSNDKVGCLEYLSWFYTTYELDGVDLEAKYTPIKAGTGVDMYGFPIIGWYNVGLLFKPGELERGEHHLVTRFWMNPLHMYPAPIVNPFTPTFDIWFTII
jgi:hypothetical protein